MTVSRRFAFPFIATVLLAGCGPIIPDSRVPQGPAPVAESASALGATVLRAQRLQVATQDASGALEAFSDSCRIARTREDVSGLTQTSDWGAPCDAAAAWPRSNANGFFETFFTPVRVGDGAAFATGYFEPEIRGDRTRRSATDVPVYGVPADLERCWRDDISETERTGRAPLSRRLPDGRCVPHFTRAEIEDGALEGSGTPVLGYASDAIEFFFLQIQGSGRLVTDSGEVIRIGYANQNGHGYTGIGALMRQRGLIGEGTDYATSMQGIVQYLRDHPAQGRAIMRENASWIFFTELTGPNARIGPLGSIGVPVRGQSSVAVDPRFVPYGAPVLLDVDRSVANGLWVAQDTGGAIKGPNRFDTFWGAGEQAREIAGGMSARGQATILLPRAAAQRLGR
ncbi:MAG: MltA domain-containing protein [Alteraurantiacibacter sp.]